MRAFSTVLTVMLLVVPALHAQVVPDGATNTLSNVTNTIPGDVTVGTNGSFTLLILSDNALLTNSVRGLIGRNATARSNEVRLVSASARWRMGNNLFVGSNGASSRLVVSNGALVENFDGILANGLASSNNVALVTGGGSVWSNRGDLTVGFSGRENQLIVSNGARVANRFGYLGRQPGSSNNFARVSGSGSVWSNQFDLGVGANDRSNRLVIEAGGVVSCANGVVSGSSSSGNNEVLVTGQGSLWSNRFFLFMGDVAGRNRLVVSNGATVWSGGGILGTLSPAVSNLVIVTGPGSVWTNASSLTLGEGSSGNRVDVNNGGQLACADGSVGLNAGANNNTVLLTGAGSTWNNLANLMVGNSGSGNVLAVSDGGVVQSQQGIVGGAGSGSSNVAVVRGSGALWKTAELVVGNSGSGNFLIVSNGGVVGAGNTKIGNNNTGSNNVLVVTGSGSLCSNVTSVGVGGSGVGNQLVVSNGGSVFAPSGVFVGVLPQSTGNRVTVDGGTLRATNAAGTGQLDVRRGSAVFNAGLTDLDQLLVTNAGGNFEFNGGTLITRGAAISNSTTFHVGYGNAAPAVWDVRAGVNNHSLGVALTIGNSFPFHQMLITNGATLTSGDSFVGFNPGANSNAVVLSGSGSKWVAAGMSVGYGGAFNRLTVSGGARAEGFDAFIGKEAGSSNNLAVVTGAGSLWTNRDEMYVGESGSGNQLVISNGGTAFAQFTRFLSHSSGATSNNTAIVTGAGSRWLGPGNLEVGGPGSSCRLLVTDGGLVEDASGFIGSGSSASNNLALVAGAGSLWTNATDLYVGSSGAGNQLVVSNAGTVFGYRGVIGLHASSSNNLAVVTGPGSLWSNAAVLFVGSNGMGNRLVVSNGGLVTATAPGTPLIIGERPNSANNEVVITGTGSVYSNVAGINVNLGENGSSNRMRIEEGGLLVGNVLVGYGTTSTGNVLTVTGPGSRLFVPRDDIEIFVGGNGPGNLLIVSNGAAVLGDGGAIGYNATSRNNLAVVTGSGSVWSNQNVLQVGRFGPNNRLLITDGGTVSSTNTVNVGFQITTSSNNLLHVANGTLRVQNMAGTGALDIRSGTNRFDNGLIDLDRLVMTNTLGFFEFNGGTLITRGAVISNGAPFTVGGPGGIPAVWDVRAGSNPHIVAITSLRVGGDSAFNRLLVTNGASLTGSDDFIGFSSGANSNSAIVAGAGSRWAMGDFSVGQGGSFNLLVISNSGRVASFRSEIGVNPGSSNNLALVTGLGSEWSHTNDLHVGVSGAGNRLVVEDGAMVGNEIGYLGGNTFSSNNQALVTGSGSLWTNRQELSVGLNGIGNQLVVSNGGTVFTFANKYVGYNDGALSNTAIVTGPGSRWLGDDSLYVGSAGSFNRLLVLNGAQVVSGIGTLGGILGANSNQVLVADAGSMWTNQLDLNVGEGGSGNRLVVSNGAAILGASDGFIGRFSGANANSAIVTGLGTLWLLSSNLYVGSNGAFSRLVITNGAWVRNARGTVGNGASSSNNFVMVTGAGSVWSNANDLYVGNSGGGNQLVVSNGGKVVAAGSSSIGNGSGGHSNLVIVTDPVTSWMVRGNLSVGGNSMSNLLVITNGGQVISENGSGLFGLSPSSRWNRAVVTGPGSLWSNRFDLYVGFSGEGNQLVVSDGGKVHSDAGLFGVSTTSTNNVAVVTGAGSIWSNQNSFRVGEFGSGNRLMITNGGRVDSSTADIAFNASSSNNEVVVTGPGSFFRVQNTLIVGSSGGGNRLVVGNGASLHDDNIHIGFFGTNNEVVVTGPGTTWTNRSGIQIGRFRGHNRLLITDEAFVFAREVYVSLDPLATNNRVVVDGGSLLVTNSTGVGALDVQRGTNVLNAGLIDVARLMVTNALGQFEFNGGKLVTSGTAIGNGRVFTVGNGASAATFVLRNGMHSFADNLVIASNAFLFGNGTVLGTPTIQPGGTLAPGLSIGNLAFSSSPVLQGATIMELDKSGSVVTNDQIQVAGTLTYGGSLTVTNLGLDLPAAGSRYVLFSASSYAGSFSSITLPPLTPGLSWTNKLSLDGSIEVVLPPPPTLNIQFSNNLVTVSWPTNAADFCLETTFDLEPPVFWQPITNAVTTSGPTFLVNLANHSGVAKQFFRLAYPCAPEPVILALQRNNNLMTVSWPSNACRLETSFSLTPPVSWLTISNGISDSSGTRAFTFTNNPAVTSQFFRLVFP